MAINDDKSIDYITQSTIQKEYGWTKSLMDKYLPQPKLATNPHYKSAAPMKLYDRAVVLEIMQTEAWIADFEKATARKAIASAATNNRKKTIAAADAEVAQQYREGGLDRVIQSVTIDIVDEATLYLNGVEAVVNASAPEGVDYTKYYDGPARREMMVEYIRRKHVHYSSAIDRFLRNNENREIYFDFEVQIFNKIKENYPQYSAACLRETKRIEHDRNKYYKRHKMQKKRSQKC